MASKPSGRRHSDEKIEEVNLIPIMNIMVILIPMLLFMFKFDEISIQAVAAPRMGSSGSSKGKNEDKKALNLTVLISQKGFVIKQQAELQEGAEPPIYKREFPGFNEPQYDFPQLYTRLLAKKRQYPKEDVINIGAESNIPWKHVAATIDAVRLELEEGEYTDLTPWGAAKIKKQDSAEKNSDGSMKQLPVPLFPKVVFVVAE